MSCYISSLSLLHMVPLKGASSRRLSVCGGWALGLLSAACYCSSLCHRCPCVSVCTDAGSPAQCLAGSSTFLHQRQWESASTFQWTGRSLLVEGRQPACPRDFGAQSCLTPANHLWQSFGSCLLEQGLCSSLKDSLKLCISLRIF